MRAALQLECVRFLVERRRVEVNQHDLRWGWTPLMRCAHMAHHTNMPYLAVFEYLLQQGADASLTGRAVTITGIVSRPLPAPLLLVCLHGKICHAPYHVRTPEQQALPGWLSVPAAARCRCPPGWPAVTVTAVGGAGPSIPPITTLHTSSQICITLPLLPQNLCRLCKTMLPRQQDFRMSCRVSWVC